MLLWLKNGGLLSDIDAFEHGVLDQAEQVYHSHNFNQGAQKDESVSPVFNAFFREQKVDSLAENVPDRRIRGPNAYNNPTAFAGEPIAQDSEIDGPGEGLNCPVDGFDAEKVGGVLLGVRDKLKTAED